MRQGLGAGGWGGGTPLPSRGTRAQLQEEAAGDTREAESGGGGENMWSDATLQKIKRQGDGSNALGESEERDKVVRMTPFAVARVSVGLGASCCGWEVEGEGVGKGG